MNTADSSPPDATHRLPRLSNFAVRVLTGVILLPVVLLAAYLDGWLLTVLVALVAGIGVLEFYVFAQGRQSQGSALVGVPMVLSVVLAFHVREHRLWVGALAVGAALTFILQTLRHPNDLRRTLWQVETTLAGVVYIAFPASFIIAIRAIQPDAEGLTWLLVVFAITWGTDSFAYLGGRYFGRKKLVPLLSPKKTVEGAIVGVIGGIIPAAIILVVTGKLSAATLILIGLGPFAAIAGDLFESGLKRFFKIKDSHVVGLNIFPGHGGVLDRVDSLLWVAALIYGYLLLGGIIQ